MRLAYLLALALTAAPTSADFSGKVVGVSDGDTITVLNGTTEVVQAGLPRGVEEG
ncbi:MAG: hypothetical protein ISQ70_01560 [Pirellulales bacterium]|nr:hypothetical protein [Pirellulales bacterium]